MSVYKHRPPANEIAVAFGPAEGGFQLATALMDVVANASAGKMLMNVCIAAAGKTVLITRSLVNMLSQLQSDNLGFTVTVFWLKFRSLKVPLLTSIKVPNKA